MRRWALVISMISCQAWAADKIVIIVNADTKIESIDASDLADFYFKKKKYWPDGSQVRFVDQSSNSPEHKIFISSVLDKTSGFIDQFWVGQKLYTGDSAPLRVMSNSMVIQFVSSFKGAVGYVSESTPLNDPSGKKLPGDTQVKILKLTGVREK